MIAWGCHERIKVYPPPRTPDVPSSQAGTRPPVKPPAIPKIDPGLPIESGASLMILERAESDFRLGEYPQAIQGYEAFLKANPQFRSRDRILFNIGLSQALPPEPGRNLPAAKTALKQLIDEFPDSVYKNQAELVLGLIGQVDKLNVDIQMQISKIERLQEELNRLKEIDLKRRPSRPSDQ